jgi:hypothetical protein
MERAAPDTVQFKVTRQGDSYYTVSGDLSDCTCPRFKQLRVMCQHALAVKAHTTRELREADRVHKGYLLSSQLAMYSTAPMVADLGNLVPVAYEVTVPPLRPNPNPEPVGLDDEDLDQHEWGPTGEDGSLLHPVVPQGLAQRLAQLQQFRLERQREEGE